MSQDVRSALVEYVELQTWSDEIRTTISNEAFDSAHRGRELLREWAQQGHHTPEESAEFRVEMDAIQSTIDLLPDRLKAFHRKRLERNARIVAMATDLAVATDRSVIDLVEVMVAGYRRELDVDWMPVTTLMDDFRQQMSNLELPADLGHVVTLVEQLLALGDLSDHLFGAVTPLFHCCPPRSILGHRDSPY